MPATQHNARTLCTLQLSGKTAISLENCSLTPGTKPQRAGKLLAQYIKNTFKNLTKLRVKKKTPNPHNFRVYSLQQVNLNSILCP